MKGNLQKEQGVPAKSSTVPEKSPEKVQAGRKKALKKRMVYNEAAKQKKEAARLEEERRERAADILREEDRRKFTEEVLREDVREVYSDERIHEGEYVGNGNGPDHGKRKRQKKLTYEEQKRSAGRRSNRLIFDDGENAEGFPGRHTSARQDSVMSASARAARKKTAQAMGNSKAVWEEAESRVLARLTPAWREENISGIPHMIMRDMAVTYYLPADGGSEEDDIPVTDEVFSEYGIDIMTLHNAAVHNVGDMEHVRFDNTLAVMLEMLKEADPRITMEDLKAMYPEDAADMYMLTNDSGHYGSAAILNEDVLNMVAEETGGAFYILPSSVDEVFIIPGSAGKDADELEAIVQTVNMDVPMDKVLSAHVYEYDRENTDFRMELRCGSYTTDEKSNS